MAASSAFTLDGVKFKLSEGFKPKPMITIPCTIRKKEINTLLHKYNVSYYISRFYGFSFYTLVPSVLFNTFFRYR